MTCCRKLTKLFLIIPILLFSGCTFRDTKNIQLPDNIYISSVFLDFNHQVFRHIGFNESRSDILKKEKGKLNLKDTLENALFYEYVFPKDATSYKSLDYAEISYFFKEDKLDIITVTFYIAVEENMDTISAVLSKIYNEKYGKSYSDQEKYLVWDASYEKNRRTTIKYDIAIKKQKVPYEDTKLLIEFMRY